MVERVKNYIWQLFLSGHWWAEFWSAIVAIGWGIWNFCDPTSLIGFSNYKIISSLGSERFWECTAMCVGTLQFVTLVWNQRWPRALGAFGSCYFYTFFTLGFLMATPVPFGWVFAAGYAGSNVFALLRLVGNVK